MATAPFPDARLASNSTEAPAQVHVGTQGPGRSFILTVATLSDNAFFN